MSYTSTFNALNTSNTTAGQKLVLSVIASFERAGSGKAWPSVATIAKRASLSARTVNYHIASLIKLGYIQRIYRSGRSAITRLFIGQTPAKIADATPAKIADIESVRFESVNDSGTPPATPEPSTETATAAIVVFTENEHPITKAITEEMPDVLAIDSMVPVPEVTGCHPQAGMPIEACTAPVEPSQEALDTDPLADVPATLLQDLGEVRKAKKKPAKVTRTEAQILAQEAAKAGLSVKDVVLLMVLRGWSRFEASWIPHVPPQAVVQGPQSVFVPEVVKPASPGAIARFKEVWAKQRAEMVANAAQRRLDRAAAQNA